MLEPPCLKAAVSIGTGFPTRSYKKYIINNRQCPKGVVKHPKKGKKENEERCQRTATQ